MREWADGRGDDEIAVDRALDMVDGDDAELKKGILALALIPVAAVLALAVWGIVLGWPPLAWISILVFDFGYCLALRMWRS